MVDLQNNKKLIIIIAAIAALVIIAGIAISIFSSSSNKTEKAPEDQTIGEILDGCMQTCSQLSGSTKTDCEAGCTQARQTTVSEFEKAGIVGAEDMTTEEALQEIKANCVNICQTNPQIPEEYRAECVIKCESVQ
jgi:hypothetical protein